MVFRETNKERLKAPGIIEIQNLLDEVVKHIFNTINKVNVGIVQDFNVEDQTATIKMAIKRRVSENLEDKKQYQEYSILINCPCIVLGGGEGSLEFPISSGDECLLLFNDRDIDNWFTSGEISIPNTDRVHNISDAIAIVGLRSLKNSLKNYLNNGVKLKYKDTKVVLKEKTIENTTKDLVKFETTDNGSNMEFKSKEKISFQANQSGSIIEFIGNLIKFNDYMAVSGSNFSINVNVNVDASLTANSIKADNGASGVFDTVRVVKGIVVEGWD